MNKARASGLLLLVTGLLVWEFAARWLQLSALVLPAPSLVLGALWQGIRTGYLWPHLAQTSLEVGLGLALGGTLGFAGGIVLGESDYVRRMLMPYLVTSQVVPKLALGPLFIVWFGFGTLPTVVMTALICFFPLLENTQTALQKVDARRLELFRMLRASRWQTLWRLKIPAGLPGIMAGLRVAVVLALVGAVVGEFVGGSKGLGALIIASQGMMDTPLMFAVLLVITALGLLMYQCTLKLEQWLLKDYVEIS